MVDELIQIVDFSHRTNGKLAQMRVDHDRLCIRIADDANAYVTHKLVQLIAELRAEIRVFDVVNRTVKQFTVVGHHARTFGAEMGMIVNAIEQILDARMFWNSAKKAAHIYNINKVYKQKTIHKNVPVDGPQKYRKNQLNKKRFQKLAFSYQPNE